jgi:chromosome segregation ATPase
MAPNMKAIERLEGVENRLHDTEKDFENSRKEAKKAKDRFQAVKDKRYLNTFSSDSRICWVLTWKKVRAF